MVRSDKELSNAIKEGQLRQIEQRVRLRRLVIERLLRRCPDSVNIFYDYAIDLRLINADGEALPGDPSVKSQASQEPRVGKITPSSQKSMDLARGREVVAQNRLGKMRPRQHIGR